LFIGSFLAALEASELEIRDVNARIAVASQMRTPEQARRSWDEELNRIAESDIKTKRAILDKVRRKIVCAELVDLGSAHAHNP
jgi:hypothetical protein